MMTSVQQLDLPAIFSTARSDARSGLTYLVFGLLNRN